MRTSLLLKRTTLQEATLHADLTSKGMPTLQAVQACQRRMARRIERLMREHDMGEGASNFFAVVWHALKVGPALASPNTPKHETFKPTLNPKP